MKTILFVCTGNVCRSPMAEGLSAKSSEGAGFSSASAGVGRRWTGCRERVCVQALRELDIDISSQRSRMLTAELVPPADYIFGMTPQPRRCDHGCSIRRRREDFFVGGRV